MAAKTTRRVSLLTIDLLFKTRETVLLETFARTAISINVVPLNFVEPRAVFGSAVDLAIFPMTLLLPITKTDCNRFH